mmetsp:Transcript_4853/g.16920  ORF Transcript_4853/g.16920 Transcript_4853/m.16920 type:complete len:364 (+) Transcript_4853:1067-2158(+)
MKTWSVATRSPAFGAGVGSTPPASLLPMAAVSSLLLSLAAQLSSTLVTASAEVVSLDTMSSTASAGLASLLSGLLMDWKYAAMSVRPPQYAARPSERTRAFWKPEKTTADGWWMVHTTAVQQRRAMEESRVMTAAAAAESRPDVGSSRIMTDGCLTRATASVRRRRCPPERPLNSIPPALVSWHDVIPVTESKSSTADARADSESSGLYILNAKSKCWRGVKVGQRLSSRGTYMAFLTNLLRVMGTPFSVIFPVGVPGPLLKVSVSRRMVLPAPEGPRMASTSPLDTEAEMCWSTCKDPLFCGMEYAMSWNAKVISWAPSGVITEASFPPGEEGSSGNSLPLLVQLWPADTDSSGASSSTMTA